MIKGAKIEKVLLFRGVCSKNKNNKREYLPISL